MILDGDAVPPPPPLFTLVGLPLYMSLETLRYWYKHNTNIKWRIERTESNKKTVVSAKHDKWFFFYSTKYNIRSFTR